MCDPGFHTKDNLWEINEGMYVYFKDLEKANDIVCRRKLFELLRKGNGKGDFRNGSSLL